MRNRRAEISGQTSSDPGLLPPGARSDFVEVNGIRMHYVTVGSGKPLILLHGWPQTWWSWRHVMERFSDRYQLIAPDLRGCGLSEITEDGYDKKTLAEDVCALIDKLAGGKAVVVAHDMGGKVSYMLCHLHPDRLEKLVLIDCQVPGLENPSALAGKAWHFGFHMAEGFPEMLTKDRERDYIGGQLRNWSYRDNVFTEDEITEYASRYSQPGRMVAGFKYYRTLGEDGAFAKQFLGRQLPMPVMTVAGSHGANTLLADAMKKEVPDLVSHVIPNCGHFVIAEAYEKFCQYLEEFLGSEPAYGKA